VSNAITLFQGTNKRVRTVVIESSDNGSALAPVDISGAELVEFEAFDGSIADDTATLVIRLDNDTGTGHGGLAFTTDGEDGSISLTFLTAHLAVPFDGHWRIRTTYASGQVDYWPEASVFPRFTIVKTTVLEETPTP